jgi:hypothetical protein
MALKKITYNGSSKVIINLCKMVNELIDSSGSAYTAGDGIDITNSVISLEYLEVQNGKVCIKYEE